MFGHLKRVYDLMHEVTVAFSIATVTKKQSENGGKSGTFTPAIFYEIVNKKSSNPTFLLVFELLLRQTLTFLLYQLSTGCCYNF